MDYLQLLRCDFPELSNVIRTHHLPLWLATDPLELVSWLILMRKLNVHLDHFPHVLTECVESLGSVFAIATFSDGGPPMIGDVSFVADCGIPESEIAFLLEVDSNFKASSYVALDDNLMRLSSVGKLVLEFPEVDNTPLLRYTPELHGRVFVAKEDEEIKSTHDDVTVSSDKDGSLSSDCSGLTLSEYLSNQGESTVPDSEIGPSLFSDDTEETASFSEITSVPSDNASDVEVPWKRRPIKN